MENGYWIDRKYELECSECGIVQEDNLCKWDFCPCCGTDMREKRYFIKSLFTEWKEVGKERYFEYIELWEKKYLKNRFGDEKPNTFED